MSKVFYDHLIVFEELSVEVGKVARTQEEREEIWRIVDEILHLRIIDIILERLAIEHHKEFLEKFHSSPFDDGIMEFLNDRIGKDIEKFIKEEIKKLEKEIIKSIKGREK